MITITFLGTSSMVPTKERNHTSIYIDIGDQALLFDCGEGTQRQITIAGLKAQKISAIFLSHWHGDHVLGLPGLLQTLAAQGYEKTLTIYGPRGTQQHMEALFKAFVFDKQLSLTIKEITKEGMIARKGDYTIKAYSLHHGIPTLGYRLQEKDKWKMNKQKLAAIGLKDQRIKTLQQGKAISINGEIIKPEDVAKKQKGKRIGLIFDTGLCPNLQKIAQDATVLISEATYSHELEDKAQEYNHLTVTQVAHLAAQYNVKQLLLTHFSSRYKEITPLLEEARIIFPNTLAAHDFMKIKI